ncbi:MAG: MFS transporter [Acidimicrobiales bacterium]|nr:MFS transporter [Acidimicrobiales bacterium]
MNLLSTINLLTTEPARPARVRESPRGWAYATATVCFGAFMGQLDASVVTLTYRPLQRQFAAGAAAVQWVSLSYLLVLVALLAPVGRRSDRAGRKLTYVHGFVLFTVASAACGLAPNLVLLILGRSVQAVGAAMLQANSVALITEAAPASRLRSALGVQAAAQALGLALGPTVGGLIVAALGWRWVFVINVPVGLVAVPAAMLLLPRTKARRPAGRTDRAGVIFLTAATAGGLLVLSALAGLAVPPLATAAFAVATVAACGAVVWRQRVGTTPVLARRVLATEGVRRSLAAALMAYLLLFGPLVLVPLVLERRGTSPLVAGLIVTALPAGFAFSATVGGGIVPRRWMDQERALAGGVLATAALVLAVASPFQTPWLVVWLAALGAGIGILAPANNASIMRAVPPDVTASAGGILNMIRSLGTAIGVSVVTLSLHAGGHGGALAGLLGVAVLALAALAT